MKNKLHIESLIYKSFNDTLSEEESRILYNWLHESQENQQRYTQLLSIWNTSTPAFDINSIDVDKAEKKVINALTTTRERSVLLWNKWQKVAAILIFPVLIAMGYLFFSRNLSTERLTFQDIYSPFGSVSKIILPDNSLVWLNSGSHLQFPLSFEGIERQVSLSGEAYFEVKSDKKHPFIVVTQSSKVRATGTHFNVEAYSTDTLTAVTLVEGILDIDINKSRQVQILPNQRIVFNSNKNDYDLRNTEAQLWTQWKDGKLVFRDIPLDEVFKRLSRAYNVEITVKDKTIAKQPYRATFEGETLDEILYLLQLTTPLQYERTAKRKLEDDSFTKEKIEVYKGK